MAQNWYPVIDRSLCIECGVCVAFCSHGVYDVARSPYPHVANPEGCVDHCHGCGAQCPVGAIRYAFDDTGWLPPKGKQIEELSCCCGGETKGCSCDTQKTDDKEILVEYLYLDLETCERCVGTDKILEEVLVVLSPALELAGYDIKLQKVEMSTIEIAERYRFLSSPTIRVKGRDICSTVQENNCGCCSDISDAAVDCRVFEYEGKTYEVAPKQMLAEALLQNIFGTSVQDRSCSEYKLPENLMRFFIGKESHKNCSCGCDCQ